MTITEAFDIRDEIIGKQIGSVAVKHMDRLQETLAHEAIDVVILTTPESAAQHVAASIGGSRGQGNSELLTCTY